MENADLLRRITARWADCLHADEDDEAEAERLGLIECLDVTEEDIENHPNPTDAGIDMGGGIWKLTEAGRAALEQADRN